MINYLNCLVWLSNLIKKEIPIVYGVTIVGSDKIDSNHDKD